MAITDNDNSNSDTFQCSICFESLNAPASIDEEDPEPISNMPGASSSSRRSNQRNAAKSKEDPGLNEVVATNCGHLYHHACLLKWLKNKAGKKRCPTCRKKVKQDKLLRVYPGTSSGGSHSSSASTEDEGDNEDEEEVGMEEDIKEIMHKTLMNDHEDLLKKFQEVKENEELKDTQITSLAQNNTNKDTEIRSLKRKIQALQQSSSSSSSEAVDGEANKRRCTE